jgi:hypothetical protein
MNTLWGAPPWVTLIEIGLTVAFLFFSIFLPQGTLKKKEAQPPDPQIQGDTVAEVREQLRSHELAVIDKTFAPLLEDESKKPNLDREHLAKKILAGIDYAIKRHDWYEDQRSRMLQISLALTTAVLAVVALIARSEVSLDGSQKVVFVGLGIVTLFSVIRQIFLYNGEFDAVRPYRSISDITFWYFRYNLPPTAPDNCGDKVQMAKLVAAERKHFVDRAGANASWKLSLREDLEQLFILHALQRYRANSLAYMRWTLTYFAVAFAGHFFLFILAAFFAK